MVSFWEHDQTPRAADGAWDEDATQYDRVTEREGRDEYVSYRRHADGAHPAYALVTEAQFTRFERAEQTEHGAALVERIEPVLEPDGRVSGYVAYVPRDGQWQEVRDVTVVRVLRRVAAESVAWVAALAQAEAEGARERAVA